MANERRFIGGSLDGQTRTDVWARHYHLAVRKDGRIFKETYTLNAANRPVIEMRLVDTVDITEQVADQAAKLREESMRRALGLDEDE